jgi:polysaccharide biosynthesis protein VpsQ
VKWIAILFALFIVLTIILADLGKLEIPGFINRIPHGDKAGHFILYGILTLLIDLSLFRSLPNQSRNLLAVKCGLIFALLIGLEEYSQQFFSSRTFSLADLFASYLGVIIFSWVGLQSHRLITVSE